MLKRAAKKLRKGVLFLSRSATWEVRHLLPTKDITMDTLHGRLSFSVKDRYIGRALYVRREYGLQEIEIAMDLLKRNGKLSQANKGYLIDVGSNIGTVCIKLLLDGMFAGALAFEPDPLSFSYLVRNIEQNHLTNCIVPHPVGLSAVDTELPFELSPDNYGDHRIRMSSEPPLDLYEERSRRTVSVPVRRLDTILSSSSIPLEAVQLVWMDTQGHEGHVLQGALKLLAHGVSVVTEFWPYGLARSGTDPGMFSDIVVNNFTHVYNLREVNPEKRPASYVWEMFKLYTGTRFTDILLLRDST